MTISAERVVELGADEHSLWQTLGLQCCDPTPMNVACWPNFWGSMTTSFLKAILTTIVVNVWQLPFSKTCQCKVKLRWLTAIKQAPLPVYRPSKCSKSRFRGPEFQNFLEPKLFWPSVVIFQSSVRTPLVQLLTPPQTRVKCLAWTPKPWNWIPRH